jgi:Fic family protein
MQKNSSSRKSSFLQSDEYDLLIHDEGAVALLEAENGLLQFDAVLALASSAIGERKLDFTPALILELNRIAIQGIRRSAGQFRTVPIGITNTPHNPPPPEEVEAHVKDMCAYVNEHWRAASDDLKDAIHLGAYLMWRLNWIHPFRDGNGRTSRVVSYLALTARLGQLLPGEPTIPDQIVDNREPYYHALDDADAAWKKGTLDVSTMEDLIEKLLERQLSSGS